MLPYKAESAGMMVVKVNARDISRNALTVVIFRKCCCLKEYTTVINADYK